MQDPANDQISMYLEWVQLFFQANGIEDKKDCMLTTI